MKKRWDQSSLLIMKTVAKDEIEETSFSCICSTINSLDPFTEKPQGFDSIPSLLRLHL